MNTKAFLVGIGIILFASVAFLMSQHRQPVGREGSLANIDISTTPEIQEGSPTPQGNEAVVGNPVSNSVLTYTLLEQNNSGISGRVDIKERNGKANIIILATNDDGVHPAHFHSGTCENPGPIIHSLTPVRNGTSQTTLTVSLEELKAQLPLILNVHKSEREISTYISCGVITNDMKERL